MLKKSLYLMCTASLLSAATTMCYKKDHLDPSTIESIALDGGKCDGKLSVQDMQKEGYEIDSMKLQDGQSGFNYIYVFTNNTKTSVPVSTAVAAVALTDEQLTARLEKIQKKQEKKVEEEKQISSLEEATKLYNTTCKRCHGNGSIRAYNSAEPLNSLSLEDMQLAIRDYTNGTKDNGMAILMTPYANTITKKDVEGIYNYLQTLK